MRGIRYVLLGLVLLAAGSAPASEPDARLRILRLLAAHHALPERAVFERVVPEARAVLFELARDERAGPYRARALSALAAWRDDEVRVLLREQASTGRGAPRHRAILLLGSVFADVAALEPHLGDADPAIRLTAAVALTRTGSSAALRAALEREREPAVRAALARALERQLPMR